MNSQQIEEVLEKIWTCRESNENRLSVIKGKCKVAMTPEILADLEKQDLVAYNQDEILLTYKGKRCASDVIRRHRLAERLLTDVLNMDVNEIEPRACEFEHLVVEEVIDSICILLGHPRECPHGRPIPSGKCCRAASQAVGNTITSLDKLSVGEVGKIAYVSIQNNHDRLHKLISFGLTAGVKVRVHQKVPTVVIKCDQNEFALEKEVAANIFVWKDNVTASVKAG